MTRVEIAPSVLASDFSRLGEQLREAESAGADRLHYDVMDGRFVPNISMGASILGSVRGHVSIPIEAHLMIVEPERYVADFATAGADLITVHAEAAPHLYRVLEQIRGLGKRAGVAINPATALTAIEEVLGLADLILVMTVNPGFGGQRFIGAMLPKIRNLRTLLDERGLPTEIEVDGGIDRQTAKDVTAAGARVLVAGTSVFGAASGIAAALRGLRDGAEHGLSGASA